MNELVSIIITTKNREALLPRALKSAINQSYKNIEIIVVDDCSSDNTEKIVKEYIKNDSRIKYIKNNIPSGANVSRNKGIKIANGKFIAGLDDDDEFMTNRIELLLNNYDEKYAFITSNNIIIHDGYIHITKYKPIINIEDMLFDNAIDNQGLILKYRLQEVDMYDEKLTACQDYDIWMKLILKYGKIQTIEESTQIIYRSISKQSISTKSRKKYYGYFNFYKKYKYLMNDYHKKAHLIRIYDIKSKNNISCELAIKLLIKKIKNSSIKQFSIFGINSIAIEIIKFMNDNNIKINHLIDSNKKEIKIENHLIMSLDDVIDIETNFIICSIASYPQMKDILCKHIEADKLNLISI
ncbi:MULTISPECIES: glycosyltransferase [Arcobacteraceae]|uniref:glycosyltransferase n=1 Tax=Arcobacteraceae TaxID=2808963 RepID=UPI000DE8C60D|nr:glycosyltransferase [Arcobacter sp. CECT 9188]RBQ26586.1 hypothetical protein CRU88_06795 [Arcobacter sp. CECT 9188]